MNSALPIGFSNCEAKKVGVESTLIHMEDGGYGWRPPANRAENYLLNAAGGLKLSLSRWRICFYFGDRLSDRIFFFLRCRFFVRFDQRLTNGLKILRRNFFWLTSVTHAPLIAVVKKLHL